MRMSLSPTRVRRTSLDLSGLSRWGDEAMESFVGSGTRLRGHEKPRPCNFSEEGDDYEMQGDYHEVQRNDEEEIEWQHHLNSCTEDQLMEDIAKAAIEEAKARATANEAEVPEFIKVKRKGKCQASKWFEGTEPGMVFKNGSQG